MDRDLDVFGIYRGITSRIKKRFLKKPNFTEASEQFGSLANALKNQECPQYAGFCFVAKARCENTVGNAIAEGESLLQAARLFFKEEKDNIDLRCVAVQEHVTEAVHLYNQTVKLYQKEGNYGLAALASLECGHNLLLINHTEEAYCHFIRAAEIQRPYNFFDYLSTLLVAANCKLLINDYSTGLKHLLEITTACNELTKEDRSSYSLNQILQYVEISTVLTLLILRNCPMDMKEEHSKVMERYTWESDNENDEIGVLPEDIFLLIQSVVMATQAEDGDILLEMENELYVHLDAVQCDLLHKIIEEFS